MPLDPTAAGATTSGVPAQPGVIPLTSAYLNADDRLILQNVEQCLADAATLRKWWQSRDAASPPARQFQLIRAFNRPDSAYGFFDVVDLERGPLEVMGIVQGMTYDRPDTGAAQVISAIRDELREFVIRYFMRISDFREPEAHPEAPRPSPLVPLPFGWCPPTESVWKGFGYSQIYFKLAGGGAIGKFPTNEIYAVDISELGKKFEWIVVKVRIFDFNLQFKPFGQDLPTILFPLKEESYLVLNKDWITVREAPAPGVLAEYGFGYALLRVDRAGSLLAYGPGYFAAGFQTICFQLMESGEIRVQMVFVVNRPERLLNVAMNPVQWGFAIADLFSFGMASQLLQPLKSALDTLSPAWPSFDPLLSYVWLTNQLTMGEAAKRLCISKEELEKEMLVQHFMQHYEMMIGSLLTWRQIPDWLKTDALPTWVINGVSG